MTQWMQQLLWRSVAMAALTGVLYALASCLKSRCAAKGFYLAGIILLIGFLCPVRLTVMLDSAAMPRFFASRIPVVGESPVTGSIIEAAGITASVWGDPWRIAFFVWIAGAVFTLAYRLLRHLRFLRVVRRWSAPVRDANLLAQFDAAKAELSLQGSGIAFRECACVRSPLLLWLGKPTVLFPEKPLPTEDVRFILRHELIHYRRRDLWVKTALLLATSLHWFNPAVYALCRLVALYCEMACDEKAVEREDAVGRNRYAMALIGVVQHQSRRDSTLVTTFFGGKETMKKRIDTILEPTKRHRGIVLVACVLLLTLTAGVSFATRAPATTGEALEVQKRLRDLGYIEWTLTGQYDTKTAEALRAFQRANGLWADGVAGEDTLALLFGTAFIFEIRRLEEGMAGQDVRQLQEELAALGLYTDEATGVFDEATTAAVEAFQRSAGLWPDGVAGEDVQRMVAQSLLSGKGSGATGGDGTGRSD